MKTVTIAIPARLASQRFPQKIMQKILGKTLVEWTYENCTDANVDEIVVLADDDSVVDYLMKKHIPVMKTDPDCQSGTERIASVISRLKGDIVINVQADEPLIQKDMIHDVIYLLKENEDIHIATLAKVVKNREEAENPNRVKVVLDSSNKALYFSRALIPYPRDNGSKWLIHVGMYGYRKSFLENFYNLKECRLEQMEKLEQLRFLYNGYQIGVKIGSYQLFGVDVPEDIPIVEELLKLRMRID
jgi:3-deoxy-manno-octulosonate cytidylyltransferase (CMP-KDO synthetase)